MQRQIQDSSEEGASTLQAGVPAYKFARFAEKLHKIKKILAARRGGDVRGGRPLGSATVVVYCLKMVTLIIILPPLVYKIEDYRYNII